jgi:hypothetical protein
MATYKLNTIDDALTFLALHIDSAIGLDDIEFGGELTQFHAVIEGPNYHHTIPAGLARGLWEYQEALYRAVAFVLYGDNSFRRLTEEQKAQFELIFAVTEGSSDLVASLKEFFSKLGEGFQNMDSKHKMITMVAVVVIVAGAWGAAHISDSMSDVKKHETTAEAETKSKQIAAETVATQEAAKTAQFQLISDITRRSEIANKFVKATEEGTRAIIKGASDATHISVGRNHFNRDDIVEVNQRAAKERAEARVLIDEFNVVRAETRAGGITRFWFVSQDGTEFSSVIIDEDFDSKGLNRIWDAVRQRSQLKLEVNVTFVRGQIKNSAILRVVE